MKRFRLAPGVLVAVMGLLAALVFAGSASAFHSKNPSRNLQFEGAFAVDDQYQGFDPMETSIPYVAWRGEEIRLVKCFDPQYFEPRASGSATEGGFVPGNPLTLLALEANETGEWQIMDWSGDEHVWPKFFDDHDGQTQVFFPNYGDQRNRGCFAIDITSHKPGIAIVKFKVDDEGQENGGVGSGVPGEGDPVATHQFVVIWMEFQDVRLRCLETSGPADPDCPGSGPVTENPSDTNRLGVVVQGRIPLNRQFTRELNEQLPEELQFAQGPLDDDGESSAIFPEDYPTLALTSLAHISWPLAKANNGREGDDNYQNPSCDPSTDEGSLDFPDPLACFGEDDETGNPPDYVPEPEHEPGDFWDIHDSTGPYNTGHVYGPNKPEIADICPGPEEPTHNPDCHVDQFADWDSQEPDTSVGGGGDDDCDNGDPDGAGGPEGNDTVDNCDAGEWDAFSRVFHDVAGEKSGQDLVIGPFSHTRPDETLLSDSTVNAHDAPMPAALVRASIAQDADTIGSLAADVDKHLVYNRGGDNCDDDGDPEGDFPENQHCVTGPFSGAYIPPSPTMDNNAAQDVPDRNDDGSFDLEDDDRDVASGIHGTIANNFNGYLPVFYPERPLNRGLYHYWDEVEFGDVAVAVPNECGAFLTPEGKQEIWLYTDEHGEAQFSFLAGTGFNFDPDAPVVPGRPFVNDQGGCEAAGELGTAEISVNARYPFQPLTSAGRSSNTLVKRVVSLFLKEIVCVPKTVREGVFEVGKAICTIRARDIDGSPLLDEPVCVFATPNATITLFNTGASIAPTAHLDPDGQPNCPNGLAIHLEHEDTNKNNFAEAQVIVAGVPGQQVFVHAIFTRENLERISQVVLPPTPQPPAPQPVTPQAPQPPPPPQPVTPQAPQPPPVAQEQPPPPVTPQTVETTPTTQTTPTTAQPPTTIRRPTTTRRPATTVKAKKKVQIKKKVKKVRRRGACIIRGRVVRPCVRGKG